MRQCSHCDSRHALSADTSGIPVEQPDSSALFPWCSHLRDTSRIDTELVSACPICQCHTAQATFALENMIERVMTCDGCGLGRLLPLPNSAQLAEFYPTAYYGTQGAKFEALTEWLVRLLSWRRARFLANGLPAGSRVLDVGCGSGTTLSALARMGGGRESQTQGV